METPFVYGKLATGPNFTNRKEELLRLEQNIISGTNSILISPRRWGKSSLVLCATNNAIRKDNSIRVVIIDLFNIRSEEEFYKVLMEEVLKSVSGKLDDTVQFVKTFMKQWMPKITFSPDSTQEFSLGLDWKELKKQPDEILNLAEKIAALKNYKIVICLDEFQNIGYFEDPLAFQKKLRSHWQTHKHVSYCLYGSKRHMLMEVFTSQSMPFYKFGDLLFLEKIKSEHWQKFIIDRFKSTGKSIKKGQAQRIAQYVDGHPYYVQQLAQLCWFRTEKILKNDTIDISFDALTRQLSLLFLGITETLSNSQINFLKALLDGVQQMSSKENIDFYQLGTSANVARVKKALTKKEIIDIMPDKIEFLDPLYANWLKHYYF